MNIQQNINQTLSVAGMLMSQTPMAQRTRAEAEVKAREPEREAEIKQLEAKKAIKIAEAQEKADIRKTAEISRAQEKQKHNIDSLTGIHTAQAGAITALPRTEKKGQLSAAAKDLETYNQHLLTRKAAIESGEKLYKVAPTTELATSISTWKNEIKEIEDFQKAQNEKAKIDKSEATEKAKEERKAKKEKAEEEKLAKKEKETASKAEKAAKKAEEAAKEEQSRQFRSKFLEGIYSSATDLPARQAGHEARLKGGSYGK